MPKNQILTEAQAFGKSHRKSSNSSGMRGYIYRPKLSTEKIDYKSDSASGAESGKVIKKNNNMFQLLSGLKAESASDHSSDVDAKKMDRRRISFNKRNTTGQNFESHLKQGRPAPSVLREIQNLFQEYRESEDREHAKEEMIDICDKHKIQRHQFLGYFLNNALSEKPEDFRHLLRLVLEYFYVDQKLLDNNEMKNALNVCIANLPDLAIDYPNASQYAIEMLQKMKEMTVIDNDTADLYVSHVERVRDDKEGSIGSDSDSD